MKNIIINKDTLSKYKFLSIRLENCDVYDIDIADILDIYCEAKLCGKYKENEYFASDGFIKISARASQTVESFISRENEINTKWDTRLKKRLENLDGGADVTSFSLIDNKNQEITIFVPYEPLEEILHGNEVELSNCPSFEVDKDGNMIIAFGKSSKQPNRKDNNYADLIVGYKEAFGQNVPKVLSVKVEYISTFGQKQLNCSVYFKCLDKFSKKLFAGLRFMDCKDVNVAMPFPKNVNCEIIMSKMMDGRIYVGFDGLGIDFTCASVWEYNYYCNHNKA